MSNPTTIIPVASLRPGDTVLIDGIPKTIDRHAIKHCPLMGATLWGDAKGPARTVEIMLFPVWAASGLQGYARKV
jgi:hypothetical protein